MLPFLNPRSPNSMLSLYHGILPKVVSALFTTLNWGGGEGETKFVLSMFNNFVILAGMVSRVLSKIVEWEIDRMNRVITWRPVLISCKYFTACFYTITVGFYIIFSNNISILWKRCAKFINKMNSTVIKELQAMQCYTRVWKDLTITEAW